MKKNILDYLTGTVKNHPAKTAIIEGLAKVETLSVEWLKHLKEDANAPQEEIDAITEPETIYSISEATGVMIY